ncbi:MAG TPA: hypothetical protein VKK79_18185 [Candidatus Lokiarchaeia archaeon]|nr:hypothetical protein [Candidatus Lokiarchaeia archaeon]
MAKKSDEGPLSKRMAKIDETLREKSQKNKATEGSEAKPKRVCSIEGCQNEVERSLPLEKYDSILKLANLKMKDTKSRRLFVCRDHYKVLKKYTKKEEKATYQRNSPGGMKQKAFSSKVKRLD